MKTGKILFFLTAISLFSLMIFAQGSFKPRDADEEHGWRLYNQYKASKKKEAELTKRIAQLRGDIKDSSHSTIGGLGADPSDVAEKNKAVQELKTEQTKQQNLEAAWQKKFYWRYGDLKDSDKMIFDPKTKQNMDKIQFALIYFPFNPVSNNPISKTIEWKSNWAKISANISGINSFNSSNITNGVKFEGQANSANKIKIEGLVDANSAGKGGDIVNLEGEAICSKNEKDYSVKINIKSDGVSLYTLSPTIPCTGGEAKFSYLFDPAKLANKKNLTIEAAISGGRAEFGTGIVSGNIQFTNSIPTEQPPTPVAIAKTNNPPVKGSKISTSKGQVLVSNNGKNWSPVNNGENLKTGDQLKTGANSSASFTLADVINLILGGNSFLGITNDNKSAPQLKLFGGNLKISLPKGNNLKVEMSQAIATAKGTGFELTESNERSILKVTEGVVEFRHKNTGATTNVSAGQTFVATPQGLGAVLYNPQTQPSEERQIFSTGNDYGVLNGGTSPTFTLRKAVIVTYLMTYHWNNGRGTAGGTISLKNQDGKIFGPWKVSVRNNVYWEVNSQITLMPGTYTVIDSEPSTWAQNSQSGGKGMVIIKGFILPD
jgi:hypothetical protein